ncbi:uncharacterized protein [Apostichopus japonicus]|uniref:uncharacterized protein n=1 Tax=Stichopus japonicus TaxID=307972 RepID=UPI003AB7B56E
MSYQAKAQLGKRPAKFSRMVHVTPTGRVSIKKIKVHSNRNRKRKATFRELFNSLVDGDLAPQPPECDEPSSAESRPQATRSYAEKRRSSQEEWAKQREELLAQYVRTEVLPSTATCNISGCNSSPTCRCSDCGPAVYFCMKHAVATHQGKLHLPSFWKDGSFSPAFIKQEPWEPHALHQCSSQKERPIVVVDIKGRQHCVPIKLCGCWTDTKQLVSMRLWPGTPTRPEVAFHWDLMCWLRVMSLECHISLKSLCDALFWIPPPCLPSLTGGRRIVSLDGMFGLKRWKKSGESYSPPRYNETFFINQSEVDTFLKGYKQAKTTEQNCSSFQAGSLIHTDKTSGQIDETGLFGAVCRHEMTLFFFNLKQGEQIGNAVYLIRHLIAESPTTKHYVLYDIACMLAAHLKKTGQTELLSKIALAVPAFHIYGHKPSCQVTLSCKEVNVLRSH